MNRRIVNTITALMILFCLHLNSPVFAASKENINWETDWETALKNASENKQPVLMDFYTDWCPPCKKLATITFKDKNVIHWFNKENYLLIKVNPEKDKTAEKKFKVYSYPTLVIFNSKGVEIDRLLGYYNAGDLIKALENLKKGIGTLEDLLVRCETLKKENKENTKAGFELMFKIMDKYIARADYPEALKLVARVVQLDKDNTEKQASAALFRKGYIYYKWKKYKKAVEAMLSIRKMYPGSEEAEAGYGAAAYYSEKTGDTAETLRILKDFVKYYPDSSHIEEVKKKIDRMK